MDMENMNNLQGNGLSFGQTVAASFIGSALAITVATGVGIIVANKMKGKLLNDVTNSLAADLCDLDGPGAGGIGGVDINGNLDVVDFIPGEK